MTYPSRGAIFFAMVAAILIVFSAGSVADAAKKKVVVKAKKRANVVACSARDLYNPRCRYKDEKIDLDHPKSRCDTPAMRAYHAKMVDRAVADAGGLQMAPSSTSPFLPLFSTYVQGLNGLWSAMEEPYCGYGAFGMTAAKRSYNKNVNRLRAAFLQDVKKIKIKNTRLAASTSTRFVVTSTAAE